MFIKWYIKVSHHSIYQLSNVNPFFLNPAEGLVERCSAKQFFCMESMNIAVNYDRRRRRKRNLGLFATNDNNMKQEKQY